MDEQGTFLCDSFENEHTGVREALEDVEELGRDGVIPDHDDSPPTSHPGGLHSRPHCSHTTGFVAVVIEVVDSGAEKEVERS